MAGVLRGDIVWADLNPVRGHEQGGRRPLVIISSDWFNAGSDTVIAMALTTRPQRFRFPLVVELDTAASGRRSWVKISQIRLLAQDRLGDAIGHLPDDELDLLVEAINELIT